MRELFREGLLGRIIHEASGGRVFKNDEQLDPSLLDPYRPGAAPTTSKSSSDQTLNQDRPEAPARKSTSEKSTRSEKGDEEKGSDAVKRDQAGSDGLAPTRSNGEKAKTNDEAEKGHDHQLVDWRENDPENPRNWSTGKKFFVTFLICLLTFSIYIGSAIYTPGVQEVAARFGVSNVVAILGLSLFVLGYGLGPVILAPLSEMPYFGRMPIYIITLALFVVLQLPIIYAKNIGTVLAFRFITGFVGSPALATGGATIADMYVSKKQPYGIAVWGMAATLGPTLGPVIGGFAAQYKGWTWTIWELLWLSGFCLVVLIFLLPETSSANILFRRAKRYRKATGNQNLKAQSEIEADNMAGKEIVSMVLIRPITMSVTEPIIFFLNLYIALVYALLYLWFESFPLVFSGIYGFSISMSGLAFLGLFIGGLIVLPCFMFYVYKYQEPLFNDKGEIQPELRLRPALFGCFCIPICLFWFAWSSRASVHWIVPIIGTTFFTFGIFLSFMSVLSYLGDAYPAYVASVYASNDLVRSSFGAGFPLFANAMFKKLGIDWGNSLLGFLSVAFIAIPFLLYKYGKTLRMRSKMARHDI